MRYRWFGLMGWFLLAGALQAGEVDVAPAPRTTPPAPPLKVALDQVPAHQRELVRLVIDRAILSARGPSEAFHAKPEHFCWFLDHPDRAVIAWRRLGARCVSILPHGQKSFVWTDEHGSEVVWEAVVRTGNQRVWYADGKVKPGPLLPFIPVKAVVVLHYHQDAKEDGTPIITQQSSIYLHTDSKSAAVVTKMLGNSAQRMVESGLEQLQLFFSGPSWYIHRHPEQAEMILKE